MLLSDWQVQGYLLNIRRLLLCQGFLPHVSDYFADLLRTSGADQARTRESAQYGAFSWTTLYDSLMCQAKKNCKEKPHDTMAHILIHSEVAMPQAEFALQ